MLESLEPKEVLGFFEILSDIPRGSENEKRAADWVVNFAKERGLEAFQDDMHCVLVRKPGQVGVVAHVELQHRGFHRQPLGDPSSDRQRPSEVRDEDRGALLLRHLGRREADRRVYRDPGDEDVLAFENAHRVSFARVPAWLAVRDVDQ